MPTGMARVGELSQPFRETSEALHTAYVLHRTGCSQEGVASLEWCGSSRIFAKVTASMSDRASALGNYNYPNILCFPNYLQN
jgi:hypothetical protein